MIELDARGLSCPQPVVMLQQAIEKNSSEKNIVVLVDDFAPLENVTRYAENHGFATKQVDRGDHTEIHCER